MHRIVILPTTARTRRRRQPDANPCPPAPPTRVPRLRPRFVTRRTASRNRGEKHNGRRAAAYLNESRCAALRPMFVRASSAAPARAGLSWQRRALLNNTKPTKKPIPAFCDALEKAQDAENTPGIFRLRTPCQRGACALHPAVHPRYIAKKYSWRHS
jgi:hypothetical protein